MKCECWCGCNEDALDEVDNSTTYVVTDDKELPVCFACLSECVTPATLIRTCTCDLITNY